MSSTRALVGMTPEGNPRGPQFAFWEVVELRPYNAQTGPSLVAAGHDQPVAVEATGDEAKKEAHC